MALLLPGSRISKTCHHLHSFDIDYSISGYLFEFWVENHFDLFDFRGMIVLIKFP